MDSTEKTRAKYDRIHDWRVEIKQYRSGMRLLAVHPHQKIEDLHVQFLRDYLPGKRVLEIGCGVGHITKRVAAYAKSVHALDFSKVVGYAKKINSAPNIHYLKADATRLPFPDRSFDIVLSSEVLEHVPQGEQMIAEIHRVLVPGGRVCLSTPNLWTLFDPLEMLAAIRKPSRPLRWFKLLFRRTDTNPEEFDRPLFPATLRRWFRAQGFTVLLNKTYIFNFWREPYLSLMSALDRRMKQTKRSEKFAQYFLITTDALIESRFSPLQWMGTRQFIVAVKQ